MNDHNPYVSSLAINNYVGELWAALNDSLPYFNKKTPHPRNIRQAVSKILGEQHIYDRIFSEAPNFVLPRQRVTLRVHDILVGYLKKTGDPSIIARCDKLNLLFQAYSLYFKGVERLDKSLRALKKPSEIWSEMLFESNINSAEKLCQLDVFVEFLTLHVEKVADQGRNRTAVENAKIIARGVVTQIDDENKGGWLSAYACVFGALLASSIEDHRSLGDIFSICAALIRSSNPSKFVVASTLYVDFLRCKHFLGNDDDLYPQNDPAIEAYLIIRAENKDVYQAPSWFRSAVLRAATVELRHKGYAVASPPHNWKRIGDDLKESIDLLPGSEPLDIDQHIMVLLSHGWNCMRCNDLASAGEAAQKAAAVLGAGRNFSLVRNEIDHLARSVVKRDASGPLQIDAASEALRSTARKFADRGALARAHSIYDEAKK